MDNEQGDGLASSAMSKPNKTESWRVATVWVSGEFQSSETFLGLCREADLSDAVTLRHFSESAADFDHDVVRPLAGWRPHGIVIRMTEWDKMQKLRHRLPRVPIVSTLHSPPALVDTCVICDLAEPIRLACDHLRGQGARALGLYCGGTGHAVPSRLAAFRDAAADGFELVVPPANEYLKTWSSGDLDRWKLVVRRWLRTLPKPAGVITTTLGAGEYLVKQCRHLGLHVPQDVQIIGVDDAAASLACDPHLTSMNLPMGRIAEVAMKTMLRHLRGEKPPPVVSVPGATLVPRASTGLAHVGGAAVATSLRLMQEQKSKGLTATRMARQAGVSRATLYNQFAVVTGQTPARYHRQQRLDEARRMLRESTATVATIAKACGFTSPSSFMRCFRKETGETPTEYRNKPKS